MGIKVGYITSAYPAAELKHSHVFQLQLSKRCQRRIFRHRVLDGLNDVPDLLLENLLADLRVD